MSSARGPGRRTKADITAYREAIYEIVATNRPCSVRQVYYVGIGRLWDKDKGGSRRNYNDLDRNLGVMRESGMLPWGWLTDSTRRVWIDTMYDSAEEALTRTAEFYRRDLWGRQPRRVEVWAESDSTASIVEPITRRLGVGLHSCRGQAGKEFAYASAATYRRIGKPVTILYVGDWDPTGLSIPRSLSERLRRYAGDEIEIELRRLAVTPEDIVDLDLTRHEVNTSDRNYRQFVEECRLVGLAPQDAVELEAMPPPVLRERVEERLYDLIEDADTWNATLAAEESERELLLAMASGGFAGDWGRG